MPGIRMTPDAQAALAKRLGLNYTRPDPTAHAPIPANNVPANHKPSRLFPDTPEAAIQKEESKTVSKIGAKRVFEMQEDIRKRFGDPSTRDIGHISGPYLRQLARQLAMDHGLDGVAAVRAAEEIIKDALS